MIYGGSPYAALEFGGEQKVGANGIANPAGVTAASAEHNPLGIGAAKPAGVSASASEHNPTALNPATPSGVTAASAVHQPVGVGKGVPAGVTATSAEHAPFATVSGHAFDKSAFDLAAFDTGGVAVNVFGGAPREIFSYSHERLAWSERPLVPKVIPTPEPQPVIITGSAAMEQDGPAVDCVGRVRFVGTAAATQDADFEANGEYYPQSIYGTSNVGHGPEVIAMGRMRDVDLEKFAIKMALAA